MIERFYLQDNLSFDNVDIEFDSGLIVFTGASGAGKSILFDAIMAVFGFQNPQSKIAEITLNSQNLPVKSELEQDNLLVFKQIKKDKNRYLINNQTVSREYTKQLSEQFIGFFGFKNHNFFNQESILNSLDEIIKSKDSSYNKLLDDYSLIYNQISLLKNEISSIQENEKIADEKREYLRFEISRIAKIDPKIDEYQELVKIKKELSKKDKLEKAIFEANKIFDIEHLVQNALTLMDIKSDFFDDAINELREHFEKAKDKLIDLDEVDIEEVLNRISDLSSLNKRFGSIENALLYKQEKEKELEKYENITFEKKNLENKLNLLTTKIAKLADNITNKRLDIVDLFSKTCNKYLKSLQLNSIDFKVIKIDISKNGQDDIQITINNTNIDKLSSGELNRTKLAFLVSKNEYINEKGILILDEVDANLSGAESQSVARVLKKLSTNYQILSISHQPQLSSLAKQHFLVTKQNNKSSVKLLNKDERIKEIARMISGDTIEPEAIEFAKKAIDQKL